MANQSLDAEEKEFLQSVGLRSTDLEHLVADAKPLPTDMQARMRQRVAARIEHSAAPAASGPAATAPVTAAALPEPDQPAAGRPRHSRQLRRLLATALIAVAACAAVLLTPGLFHRDAAVAMEKAVAKLTRYHGVVDIEWYTLPDRKLIEPAGSGTEIWVDGNKSASTWQRRDNRGTFMGDVWRISDGNRVWWYDTFMQEGSVGLDLDSEMVVERLGVHELARWVLRNPHTIIGTETVANRPATKMEVKTPDGITHYVWIDQETDLPLRVERYHGQRSVEVRTYRSLEINSPIDPKLFVYHIPAGYKVHESSAQWVNTAEEAAKVAGFAPVMPTEVPKRMAALENRVILVYDTVLVTEERGMPFSTHWAQQIGRAAGGPLVVAREGEQLDWQQGGLKLTVEGSEPDELLGMARTLAPDLQLPDSKENLVQQATVKIDLNTPALDAQADEAARLGGPGMEYQDPVNAAYTFFKQQLGGDWWSNEKNPFEDAGQRVNMIANTGEQAILDVKEGPYKRLYVTRLRPNSTVWIVAGYDLR